MLDKMLFSTTEENVDVSRTSIASSIVDLDIHNTNGNSEIMQYLYSTP